MTYAVINLTNYGAGYYQVGTFRSYQRAKKIAKELQDKADIARNNTKDSTDSYTVIYLKPMDNFTDESIVKAFTPKMMCYDCENEFDLEDGGYSSLEPGMWLCDDCQDGGGLGDGE